MIAKIAKFLLWLAFALVLVGAFFWAPLKEGLGPYTRVLYFHVPVAWMSVVFFLIAAYYSVMYLRKKEIIYDAYAKISNEMGILFAILATVTGSIWAKMIWHSFWNWDPRETSIFILLLIYGAYFSLRAALEQEDRRARLAAVYSLLAFVTVPFFIFIVPRIYFSLHPDPVINAQGKVNMEARQRIVFFSSLITQTIFFLWVFTIRLKQARVKYRLRELNESKLFEE